LAQAGRFLQEEHGSGETYLSLFLQYLITTFPHLGTVKIVKCQVGDVVCMGTPIQVQVFQERDANPLRICFDLDRTLVTPPVIPGDYSTVKPVPSTILKLQQLYADGHTIIIHTARRMLTHGGNAGLAVADIGATTWNTLKQFEIPYHELVFGKPYAHFYIDDKAVNAYDDLSRELGFYQTETTARYFNSLREQSLRVYQKSSEQDLSGEIWWYGHIPFSLQGLFPAMIDYAQNHKSYRLVRISAVTASHLFVNRELSLAHFRNILRALDLVHQAKDVVPDIDRVDALLLPKLESRIQQHGEVYEAFDLEPFMAKIRAAAPKALRLIREDGIKPMHGDPVFSNILITPKSDVKLIDMRGQIGDQLTIFGTRYYDYAKVYQSLIGYDTVLHGESHGESHSQSDAGVSDELLSEFVAALKVQNMDFPTVQWVTLVLLLSLLPLHEQLEKRQGYFELAHNLLLRWHQ
jgi:capsule biosynthesis phosphatase